jgi:hypothetical protein
VLRHLHGHPLGQVPLDVFKVSLQGAFGQTRHLKVVIVSSDFVLKKTEVVYFAFYLFFCITCLVNKISYSTF